MQADVKQSAGTRREVLRTEGDMLMLGVNAAGAECSVSIRNQAGRSCGTRG